MRVTRGTRGFSPETDRATMGSMDSRRVAERVPDADPPSLVVRGVSPTVDAGRYAVKRLVGDELRVGADIFKDGHDTLAARALVWAPGERRPTSVPLTYVFDDDRWYGTIPLDRPGEWRFTVEAWTDRFASWRTELEKKVAAAQDVGSELIEGAELVRTAEPHARAAARNVDLYADRAARPSRAPCLAAGWALDPRLVRAWLCAAAAPSECAERRASAHRCRSGRCTIGDCRARPAGDRRTLSEPPRAGAPGRPRRLACGHGT